MWRIGTHARYYKAGAAELKQKVTRWRIFRSLATQTAEA